jgi:uncharacterized protein (DUF2062 family)
VAVGCCLNNVLINRSRTASHSVWATLAVNLFAWMIPCQKHHLMALDLTGELT